MAGQGTRRALLIGINQYPHFPPAKQLHGCVNDVELLEGILKRQFGFPSHNIRLLRNAEATRNAILADLDSLVADAQADDIVVLAFSGHGSRVRDREGDEQDGWDETLVPYDSGRGSRPNRDITDDEIYLRLLKLTDKTPYVTLVFDCCHSGTITRDAFGDGSRWVPEDDRPDAHLPPAVELTAEQKGQLARDAEAPSGWLPLSDRYVLIAGCADKESSYEYHPPGSSATYGTLTYFLGQALIHAPPDTTYRDVFEQVSAQVTEKRRYQHPQMEGARDRVLFGVRSLKPMRFVAVTDRWDDQVTLAAGAAHGMVRGSQWAVYPKGTRAVSDATRRLGLVQVSAVHATSAEARIIESTGPGAIQANARAVEYAHTFGEARLAVALQAPPASPSADGVRTLIEKSHLLRLADPAEADVCAYLLPARGAAAAEDPVPQLGTLHKPTWAVVGQDGRLCMPVHAEEEQDVDLTLRDNLELLARYRNALALRNPDARSALRGKVDFTLLRLGTDNKWSPAEPEDAGGAIHYREGDRIALEVTNHHSRPIFFCVLDFGLSGAISLLHPVVGASEELAPNATIRVGARQGEKIELFMPNNFPFAADTLDGSQPAGGTEVFKLLATVRPADFSNYVQGGFRGEPKVEAQRLKELIALLLSGIGAREARANRVPEDQEWTSVDRCFFLSR